MISPNADDLELLEAFAKAETKHKAFECLFDKYAERLYMVARRMVINHDDADDVMQNVWVNIWNHLSEFKQASKLYTWMYRITVNEALQQIQRNKQSMLLDDEAYNEILHKQLYNGYEFNGNKIQLALQQAILMLPEKQRLVFNLKYFENLKYEEIKEILNTSVGALKASYHHAVKKIEEIMKDTLNS